MAGYFTIPALDGSGNFPPSVLDAIKASPQMQALKNEAGSVGTAAAQNVFEQLSATINRQHASGTVLPTATADRWLGRIFYLTTTKTLHIWDGSSWIPVGGRTELDWNSNVTHPAGMTLNWQTMGVVLRRNAGRIDLRFKVTKSSALLHGDVLATVAALHLPQGLGSQPLTGIQTGHASASARTVGVNINANGQIVVVGPEAGFTSVEVAGWYYSS